MKDLCQKMSLDWLQSEVLKLLGDGGKKVESLLYDIALRV